MKHHIIRFLLVFSLLGMSLMIPAGGVQAAGFSNMSTMSTARTNHSATLLSNGKILIVGGTDGQGNYFQSAELLDPATGQTTPTTGAPNCVHANHTATMLQNGLVLIAGGADSSGTAQSCVELYDPSADTFLNTVSYPMSYPRMNHTATLLQNGQVLITGGVNSDGTLQYAELYDPGSNGFIWWNIITMNSPRQNHTATVLQDGTVLLAGGASAPSGTALNSTELFNPGTNAFSATGSMLNARQSHTATLLASGKVLFAGGTNSGADVISPVEIYDPASKSCTQLAGLSTARAFHSASLLPNGTVLLAGGASSLGQSVATTASVEIFDPTLGFSITSIETFDPSTGVLITAQANLNTPRMNHAATIIPGGKVVFTGGAGYVTGVVPISRVEAFNAATGTFGTSDPLTTARSFHTATLLPNGQLLIAGGRGGSGNYLGTAELYNPATGSFSQTGNNLTDYRSAHTATLLANGQVLIAGGLDGFNSTVYTAEIYNPADGSFTGTGKMTAPRAYHASLLLSDGTVLVMGGDDSAVGKLSSAEIYNPATMTFSLTANSMSQAYPNPVAVSLADGTVLITGGYGGYASDYTLENNYRFADIYNPVTMTFAATGLMNYPRQGHSATLLPNGKVLIAGGMVSGYNSPSAELYDPATGTFTLTGSLHFARSAHSATLMPNGMVLIAGGDYHGYSELYDPASGSFSLTASLPTYMVSQTATLLPNGKILLAGGNNFDAISQSTAQLYDIGLNAPQGRIPVLSGISANTMAGTPTTSTLSASGSLFLGDSEASGSGVNNSAANYPLLQLMRIDNGLTTFVPSSDTNTPWTSTSLTTAQSQAATVAALPAGYYLASLFVNGMASSAQPLLIQPLLPAISVVASDPDSGQTISNPVSSGIAFGTVSLGNNLSSTITISNNGTAALKVRGISKTGSSDFSVATGTCSSLTPSIPASSSCTVVVTFAPSTAGAQNSDLALVITSNDPQYPSESIALSGTGVLQAQSISFTSVPSLTYGGGGGTVSATAYTGAAITYSTTTSTVCTVDTNSGAVIPLTAGMCTIAATAGSSGIYASATAYTSITIAQAVPVITWSNPATIIYGTSLSATQLNASSGGVAGQFTYSPASGALLSAGSGQILSVSFTPTDTVDYTSATASVSITVNSSSQSINPVTAPVSLTYGGAGGTISATATSGLAVTFSSTTSSVCSVSSSNNVWTVTPLTAGTCTIAADQSGNGNYSAASPVSQNITINSASQNISFGTVPSLTYGGGSGTISATATSGLAVSLASTTSSVCSVSFSNNVWTVTPLTAGTCTISATQVGNANYNSAAASITLTVAQAVPVITWSNPAAIIYGAALSVIQLNASSGGIAGQFTYTPAIGAVLSVGGAQTLSATFAPTDTVNYATPAAVSVTITVNPSAQSINAISAPGSLTYGGAAGTISATATSGLAVTFSSTTPSVCGVNFNNSTWTVTPLSAGTCTISATQAGNSNYSAASPVTQNITVNSASQTISFGTAPSLTYGTTGSIRAISTSALAVTLSSLTSTICTVGSTIVTTSASGGVVSSVTITPVAAGSCIIAADQAGNGNYAAATEATQVVLVTAAGQSISFGTAPSLTYGGATGTVSATTTSGGTVTFSSLTPTVCTVSGVKVTPVSAGTCTIAANVAGTSSYSAAAQVTQSIAVAQAIPVISWTAPSAITYGTPLSTAQLNASSGSVAGSFTYSPAIGTVLSPGTQTLYSTFTPSDSTDYNSVTATTTITVNALPASQVVTGSDGKTTIPVTVSVSGATLTLNSGTLLGDASGNPVIGTLSISASLMGSTSALPTGASAALSSSGLKLAELGSAIDITITSGSTTVKTFSPEMVVNLAVSSSFASPGAVVSYYSYDGTTWHLEGSTTVKADGSIDMPVSHLSIWAVAAFGSTVNAPVITSFTAPSTSATLTVSGIALTAVDTAGVTGYLLSESAVAPLATDAAWSATAPTTHTCSLWGNCILYGYAKDAAGNISSPSSTTVLIGPTDGVIIPSTSTSSPKLTPQMADVLLSLNFAMNVVTPTATQFTQGEVAPLVNGVPSPDPARAELNLGDTIVLLRRVVGLGE